MAIADQQSFERIMQEKTAPIDVVFRNLSYTI
jgi:hypothetical protein